MIETLIFDADDTLWHNENLFTNTHERFRELLLTYHDGEWVDKKLYATESANLSLFGYGVKGFVLSMIETAIELTEGRVSGREIQGFIDMGKDMLRAPAEALPHVAETLAALHPHYQLMVITKGDLFDQENKLARSGLGDYFQKMEVVSEKNTETYARIFAANKLDPKHLLMVGNSLKSDVLPVLPLGVIGVHIPYLTTWEHERVEEEQLVGKEYHHLNHMGLLPELLQRLGDDHE